MRSFGVAVLASTALLAAAAGPARPVSAVKLSSTEIERGVVARVDCEYKKEFRTNLEPPFRAIEIEAVPLMITFLRDGTLEFTQGSIQGPISMEENPTNAEQTCGFDFYLTPTKKRKSYIARVGDNALFIGEISFKAMKRAKNTNGDSLLIIEPLKLSNFNHHSVFTSRCRHDHLIDAKLIVNITRNQCINTTLDK